jgi:hypothetical protein
MIKPRAIPCVVAAGLFLGLSACSNPYDPVQRTIGGGLIGAGSGAQSGPRQPVGMVRRSVPRSVERLERRGVSSLRHRRHVTADLVLHLRGLRRGATVPIKCCSHFSADRYWRTCETNGPPRFRTAPGAGTKRPMPQRRLRWRTG